MAKIANGDDCTTASSVWLVWRSAVDHVLAVGDVPDDGGEYGAAVLDQLRDIDLRRKLRAVLAPREQPAPHGDLCRCRAGHREGEDLIGDLGEQPLRQQHVRVLPDHFVGVIAE